MGCMVAVYVLALCPVPVVVLSGAVAWASNECPAAGPDAPAPPGVGAPACPLFWPDGAWPPAERGLAAGVVTRAQERRHPSTNRPSLLCRAGGQGEDGAGKASAARSHSGSPVLPGWGGGSREPWGGTASTRMAGICVPERSSCSPGAVIPMGKASNDVLLALPHGVQRAWMQARLAALPCSSSSSSRV
jgi:hypothetical protein